MKTITIKVNNKVIEGPFNDKYKAGNIYYIHHLVSEDLLDFKKNSKDNFMEEEIGDLVNIAYEEQKKIINDKHIIDLIMKKTEILEKKEMTTKKTKTKSPDNATAVLTGQPLKFFKITGTSFYAHLREPNTKGNFPSNKYQVDLSINDVLTAKLTKLGVQVKTNPEKPEMGNFVRIKATKKPRIVNEDGLELTEIPLVGNGSSLTVSVGSYDNRESNIKSGKGGRKCLGMYEVQIDHLIPYNADAVALEDIDDDTLGA